MNGIGSQITSNLEKIRAIPPDSYVALQLVCIAFLTEKGGITELVKRYIIQSLGG